MSAPAQLYVDEVVIQRGRAARKELDARHGVLARNNRQIRAAGRMTDAQVAMVRFEAELVADAAAGEDAAARLAVWGTRGGWRA